MSQQTSGGSRQGGGSKMHSRYDFGNQWSVPMTVEEYRTWAVQEEIRLRELYRDFYRQKPNEEVT